MLFDFFHPLLDREEGLLFGQVVDDEGAQALSVVSASYRLKPFLASSVPYLGLDCPPGLQRDGLRRKLNTNGGKLVLRQTSFDVSTQQVRLPDIRVSHEDYLKQEIVVLVVSSIHFMNNYI